MPVYRPRCLCKLIVPTAGTAAERRDQTTREGQFHFDIGVSRATLTRNDHNQADELEIDASWEQAGVDPRLLQSACVEFWLDDARDEEEIQPTEGALRFVGVATDIERRFTEDAKTIRLKFLDYTALFLRSRPFPHDGVPDFSQTLVDAWQRICDHTGYYDLESRRILSSVSRLRDKLVFEGSARGDLVLGSAVSERIAKLGKVNAGTNKNAWEVWQHVVGSVGLISYVDRNVVVVTDAANYYTSKRAPVFVWGQDIASLVERRNADRMGKFIALVSADPLTGKTIESFFPPRDGSMGLLKERKQPKRKKPAAGGNLLPTTDYEFHQYPYGVTDQATLDACARRVWEERARQELTGTLVTHEMRAELRDTAARRDEKVRGEVAYGPFDVLALATGDLIQIQLEEDLRGPLSDAQSDSERVALLVERGYAPSVAQLVVANFRDLGSLPSEFCVRTVTTELDFSGETFSVTIEFCNRIQETGATAPTTA